MSLGDPGFTFLGIFTVSWELSWRLLPLLQVNSAVRALRALIAHLRLTGRVGGLGFLALYFWIEKFSKLGLAQGTPGH